MQASYAFGGGLSAGYPFWCYGGPFLVGDMDSPLSGWGYGKVWICDLVPGTLADVMIWDQRGPLRTHRQFFNFEIGAHDGAYKGCLHIVVPYIGRAPLSEAQEEYNNIHRFYRARVGHLFVRL